MLWKKLSIQVLICSSASCALATTGSARLISSFQAGAGGWQLGTVAVGNIDSDPLPEIIVPYREESGKTSEWFLDAFKPDGTRISGFPFRGGDQPINLSPTLVDLTGDGRNEILFTCGNRVIALKGDGNVLWSTQVSHENYLPNAGYQVVTNGFYWSWGASWRDRLPSTAAFYSEVSPLIVADLDGTGRLKVATAWKIDPDTTSTAQDYNPYIKPLFGFGEWGTVGDVWSGSAIFLDAQNGANHFTYHFHQLVESGLALGKERDGGAPLVYVLNDSDSVVAFDQTKPYGLWGKGMLHKQFGKNQRLQSGSYLKGVDVHLADLDGDGLEEVLVPTTQLDPLWQPCETILDDDGAILWRRWLDESRLPVLHGWLNSACMIPVNPDGDNRIDVLSFTHSHEIAFRSWDGIKLADRPGWPKNFHPFIPTPPVVGDVDGDGEEEVVIGTYNPSARVSHGKLHVFALDGTEKFAIDVPGGLKHIPALADVTGDGAIEVVYRSLAGRIYIHNFGSKPFGRVSWATHRGNMARDGNRGVSLFDHGTPRITGKEPGRQRARFSWQIPDGLTPQAITIFRAARADGPFHHVATLSGAAGTFTDTGLRDGWQYFYEVGAVYESGVVRSAPFPIVPFVSGNLIANGTFEEDDNSRWDKWFTGDIPWQNMIGCSVEPFQGLQCMRIMLENHGSNSSIKQSNQYGTPDPAIRTQPGKFYSFGGFIRSGGLSAHSVHWFEWNTSRTGDNLEDIPRLPWPLYFTPPLAFDNEPSPWTYVNRVFTMPEGFPNIELRHRYTTEEPGTGSLFIDNVFFRELPPPDDSRWQKLIPLGSTWKYLAATPPPSWMAIEFDDRDWPEAPAKFGGGTGPKNVSTPLPIRQPEYYFRRTFTVPDGPLDELLLGATATDHHNGKSYPLTVYINGVELVSSGIDVVSGDGNTKRFFDLAPFIDLVRPGKNTLAVIVQNGWAASWDNVAFDLSLRAIPAPQNPLSIPVFKAISPQPDGSVLLHLTGPVGSVWDVEFSATSCLSVWQPLESVTIHSAEGVLIHDRGQKTEGGRFYRVAPKS
jgi:hypothetical protein